MPSMMTCLMQCPFSMGLCLEADFIQCFEGNLCPNAEARSFGDSCMSGGGSEGKPCSNMCITNKDRPAGKLPNCFGGGQFWFGNFDGDSYKLAGNVGNGLLTLRKWSWHSVSSCKVLVCVCVCVVIFQVTRPGDVIPHKRVFLEHAISHNCLSVWCFCFWGCSIVVYVYACCWQ